MTAPATSSPSSRTWSGRATPGRPSGLEELTARPGGSRSEAAECRILWVLDAMCQSGERIQPGAALAGELEPQQSGMDRAAVGGGYE